MLKQKINTATRLLSRIGAGIISLILLFAMVFLFVSSMKGTADMNMNNPGQENIDFLTDNVWLNLLWLVLFFAIGLLLVFVARRFRLFDKLSPTRLSWMLALWVFVMGSLWVIQSMSAPTHDSLIVTRAGVSAAIGKLEHLDGDYFIRFPFQLGYVFWTELWARAFALGGGGYLFMELVNVLCLAMGEMALVRLTHRLFQSRAVTFATAIALALFIQPMIFCTFLYGTMPGFCFAVWSMLLLVRYMQTDKWRFAVGAGILLTVSVTLKLNNMILLVAAVIILLLHLLRGKYVRGLAAILIISVTVLTLRNAPVWQYEIRTDKDFGKGIPMLSWLAMGLNDAATAPGWYSHQYTVGNFNAVGNDPDAAAENSKAEIKKRIEYFSENPKEAGQFFSDKILSQWNEPTYQSIWNNQVRGQYMDKFGFAAYACGEGEQKVKDVLDLSIQFIFCGMTVAVGSLFFRQLPPIRRKKHREVLTSRREDEVALYLIPLFILGGFLYHALFEAKSQYVIGYVTLMIPYAVWGFTIISQSIKSALIFLSQLYHKADKKAYLESPSPDETPVLTGGDGTEGIII